MPNSLTRRLALLLASFLLGGQSPTTAGDKPTKRPYFDPVVKQIQGWTVHIDPKMLKGEHANAGTKALSMLGNHLERLAVLKILEL